MLASCYMVIIVVLSTCNPVQSHTLKLSQDKLLSVHNNCIMFVRHFNYCTLYLLNKTLNSCKHTGLFADNSLVSLMETL